MWITLLAHAGHDALDGPMVHSGVSYLVVGLFLVATLMVVVSGYRRESLGR
jgi:hypothetical protein